MKPTTTEEVKTLFGRRLEQARRMRGVSLRALVDRLQAAVSHNALHKYERGEMLPDSTVLRELAKALGQTTEYFFRPFTVSLAAIEFRKKSALGARAESALRVEAADFFERYLEVEEAVGIDTTFANPLEGLLIHSGADVETAAERLRDRWELGLDALGNVVELLEQHQVKVYLLVAEASFDGFSGWSGDMPVVALNKRFPADRRRLTALHELAHLLLDFDKRLEAKTVEKLCHRFAGAMLMPRAVFEREWGGRRRSVTLEELKDIKQDFGISMAATMARARDLGLMSEGDYTRFCILRNQQGWNKQEPGAFMGVEESNRFDQLLQRAVATEALSVTLAASLARKPLVEFERGIQLIP
jgi:Zn-dependent peptidase ImmA (M78 family)/DNA-binding XRE family transcriptional regulator